MSAPVPRWVRLGVVVTMGAPQLLIGLWALVMPDLWYDRFPGFAPYLVAAIPPYNEHLATDVGAGFFATAVVVLVAGIWGSRDALRIALLAYVAFTLPHVVYHALEPAEQLSGVEDLVNVLSLGSGLVLAAVFAYGVGLRPPRARAAA